MTPYPPAEPTTVLFPGRTWKPAPLDLPISPAGSPHEKLKVPAMFHILKDFANQISYNNINNNDDYHLLRGP